MPSSHPDSNLHPVATGSAKSIVDAHQAEQPLKLYSGWFCPFVQRAWTVLEEKKIPYQYIEVNPYDKPKSLLDLNPRGLVPTLQYDNKVGYIHSGRYQYCLPERLAVVLRNFLISR